MNVNDFAYPGLCGKKKENYMDEQGYGREREVNVYSQGLSKRELFAAMAMEGHCANPLMSDLAIEKIAEVSVEQADALLKALEETK